MRKPLTPPLALVSALMLSVPILSGCVDAPPTTPQLKEVAQSDLGLDGAAAPHYPREWWKAFKDPQVDRLAPMVIANNPTLLGALARLRAAQAELAVNRANDRPQVTLDGSEQRILFSNDYIIPPPFGGSYRWYGSLTADMSWDLDFWGKQADLIAKARDTAVANALDAEAAHLALSGAFAQAYVDLLLNYQNGDIADETVAERTEILSITQGRFDAGLENASAVEQAKSLLSIAEADQLRYAAAREVDLHAIAALAGQGAALYGTISRPTPEVDAAVPLPDKLPADLLSRRPDILAAKARIEAAVQGREAAHADFYPNINLEALIGFQSIGLSSMFTGSAFTMGVGPALHLPIFDAGKLRAQYAHATADLDSSVADYNGAVVGAIKQTADAMTEVKSLAAQRVHQEDAVKSAQRAYEIARERYRSGLATQLPMLTAEATLLQARQQLSGVVAEGLKQRITLLLTVGGGFEPPADFDAKIAKQDVSHD
jgi:NodT family efflux transporter outer membrane factor (OMF) lipoprotein